ncbi:MAG: type II toxin-antitoxin system RelE/ParE family toxin [Verrucomicrobiota bacterium]
MTKISFDELPEFTKKVNSVLGDDDELMELQMALVGNPEQGVVIPGTQGLRKLRWASSGKGKRGGARVIYYYWVNNSLITLCEIYKKTDKVDLDKKKYKAIRAALE